MCTVRPESGRELATLAGVSQRTVRYVEQSWRAGPGGGSARRALTQIAQAHVLIGGARPAMDAGEVAEAERTCTASLATAHTQGRAIGRR